MSKEEACCPDCLAPNPEYRKAGQIDNKPVPFEATCTNWVNKYGEHLYRSDGKAHIHKMSIFQKIVSKHKCTYEPAKYSTGGCWMADTFECEICSVCGNVKNWKKVY